MLIVLWILNALLALVFLSVGLLKVIRSREALVGAGMAWTADVPLVGVKTIGMLEVAGSLGLIIPLATGLAAVLAPIAAVCLTVMMAGAAILHLNRSETPVPAVILGLVAAASAVIGFVSV